MVLNLIYFPVASESVSSPGLFLYAAPHLAFAFKCLRMNSSGLAWCREDSVTRTPKCLWAPPSRLGPLPAYRLLKPKIWHLWGSLSFAPLQPNRQQVLWVLPSKIHLHHRPPRPAPVVSLYFNSPPASTLALYNPLSIQRFYEEENQVKDPTKAFHLT